MCANSFPQGLLREKTSLLWYSPHVGRLHLLFITSCLYFSSKFQAGVQSAKKETLPVCVCVLDRGRPDWLSTRLAGGQGLSGGPGIIMCEWLPLCRASPNRGVGELRQAWRGGLTATEVHVCFGLLLITVLQAAKLPCLWPLHQSNTLVLQ